MYDCVVTSPPLRVACPGQWSLIQMSTNSPTRREYCGVADLERWDKQERRAAGESRRCRPQVGGSERWTVSPATPSSDVPVSESLPLMPDLFAKSRQCCQQC